MDRPFLVEAISIVVEENRASTSLLQRKQRLGYARVGRLIDTMERLGVIGPRQENNSREVLITKHQWETVLKPYIEKVQQEEYDPKDVQNTAAQRENGIDEFIDQVVKEKNTEEYEKLKNEFLNYVTEYVNYYFELEELPVTVTNVKALDEEHVVIAELDLHSKVRVGQVRYRLGSLADYLNARHIKITNNVEDKAKLGIEIPFPPYLNYYGGTE